MNSNSAIRWKIDRRLDVLESHLQCEIFEMCFKATLKARRLHQIKFAAVDSTCLPVRNSVDSKTSIKSPCFVISSLSNNFVWNLRRIYHWENFFSYAKDNDVKVITDWMNVVIELKFYVFGLGDMKWRRKGHSVTLRHTHHR